MLVCAASHAETNLTYSAAQTNESPIMKDETPSQRLFFCTTRIEAESSDGKESSTGTGFIWRYNARTNEGLLFIVTCRHVVNGFPRATFSFVEDKESKPNFGHKCQVTVDGLTNLVFYDPDPSIDIALIPFGPILHYFREEGETPHFHAFSKELVPDEESANNLDAIQPVVFVGYPNGMRDEKNLLPIARRGFTATPYAVDFNGLPLFLVDANVFPGSSGSPVVVSDEGAFNTERGYSIGRRAFFLGLVSSAYFQPVEGEIQFKPIPSQYVPTYKEQRFLNIGGVIKAKALLNTVSEFVKAHPETNAVR